MAIALNQPCVHHPQRAGFAVCMECRDVVCQECATTRDGINYCRACLAKRRTADARGHSWLAMLSWVGMACVAVGMLWAAGRFMVWGMIMVASWH